MFDFPVRMAQRENIDGTVENENVYNKRFSIQKCKFISWPVRMENKNEWQKKQTTCHLFHLTCNEWVRRKKSESLDGENSNTLTHVIYNTECLMLKLMVHILIEWCFVLFSATKMPANVFLCCVDFAYDGWWLKIVVFDVIYMCMCVSAFVCVAEKWLQCSSVLNILHINSGDSIHYSKIPK